eukprot:gene30669-35686_t
MSSTSETGSRGSLSSSPSHGLPDSASFSSLSSLSSKELLNFRLPSLDPFSFDPDVYLDTHKAAVEERAQLGTGKSSKMQELYRYWHNFLIGSFNQPMYRTFKRMAEEDAATSSYYGIQLLFSFLRCRLDRYLDQRYFLNHFEDSLPQKFVDLP